MTALWRGRGGEGADAQGFAEWARRLRLVAISFPDQPNTPSFMHTVSSLARLLRFGLESGELGLGLVLGLGSGLGMRVFCPLALAFSSLNLPPSSCSLSL
jgi:hypothetical protein